MLSENEPETGNAVRLFYLHLNKTKVKLILFIIACLLLLTDNIAAMLIGVAVFFLIALLQTDKSDKYADNPMQTLR